MNANVTRRALPIVLLLCGALAPAALALGAPRPINAVAAAPPATGLSGTVEALTREAGEEVWLGYSVPIVSGDHEICCSVNGQPGVCPLDRRHGGEVLERNMEFRTTSRGAESLAVFVRMRSGAVRDVRVYDGECVVDAGGAAYVALDGVEPAESVAFLAPLAERWGDDVAEGALAALALHAADEAGLALERFTRPSGPAELRERAAFWLAVSRGAAALASLSRMAREDPSPEVREQVAFAIYISEAPAAAGMLIDVVREDESADVRAAALFWLSQMAGELAAGELRDAVSRDPDAEVREAAVFALSQLPADESIPALIDVARTSPHAEVRRMATFWLGQSGDARALGFFEELLGR